MSTPLAAGATALTREYLIKDKVIANPSAALIKAALLNSAEDISPGQYGTDVYQEIPDPPVPNNVEGWGRLNLGNAVYPEPPFDILYYDEQGSLSTGDYHKYSVNISDSNYPLKINLVWTDYPGSPVSQGGLVNDLDLQVTDPSSVIHYPDNPSQKSRVSMLTYDSDLKDTISSNNRRAIRFTPSVYPANVESTTFYFHNPSQRTTDVDEVIYDGDGAGGLLGKELFRKILTYIPSGWITVGIEGIVINNGDFYIAIEKNDIKQFIAVDDGNPSGRSYWHNGSQWARSKHTVYIRANVRGTDYSTSFDRGNNVVGLTRENPATGTYTIRVNGHNVPEGPQPYALVISGAIGSSRYTLTIIKKGTGTGVVTGTRIDCGTDCSEEYNEGMNVTLTTTPNTGSTFDGWSGDCTGTGTCNITRDAAKTVTANFSLVYCPTPDVPSNPAPSNGATGVPVNLILSWKIAPDMDSYDVYFGTPPEPLYIDNTTNTSYFRGGRGLSYNTTYFWKIVAKNDCGNSTSGPVWSFTTGSPSCTYTISKTGEEFHADGGTGSVNVTTQSGCDWTAVSNDSWITITSGSSGSGNGTVSYSVAANASVSSRNGTLTIAGHTFKIIQQGINSPIGKAVDNRSLIWTTGGDAEWFRERSIYRHGGDAAQSGNIANDQTSWVKTTVQGPGTLSFHWKVSSENRYDKLSFYIDGEKKGNISGTVKWRRKTFSIPTGSHLLKWEYTKDLTRSSGSDAGWLDKVKYRRNR